MTACIDVSIVDAQKSDDVTKTSSHSTLLRTLSPERIIDYALENHHLAASVDSIVWVLEHWPSTQLNAREVTLDTLSRLRKCWQHHPHKHTSQYRQALQCILVYLHHKLGWQVPDIEKKKLIDQDAKLFVSITAYAHDAHTLIAAYETSLQSFYQKRGDLCAEWVALIIAMEVAPLPVDYLLQAVSSPTCLELRGADTYLKLEHINVNTTKEQSAPFTRYHLPLLAYRALLDYHRASKLNKAPNAQSFTTRLAHLVRTLRRGHERTHPPSDTNEQAALSSPTSLHLLLQAVWYFRDDVPPMFLKDIAYPQRHVAFDKHTVATQEKKAALDDVYRQNWDDKWYEKRKKKASKKWPHRALVDDYTKNNKRPTHYQIAQWQIDNVLPQLVCLFVKSLILHGGARKSSLAKSTVADYASLQALLNPHPLSFERAHDHLALMHWAHDVYDGLGTFSAQQKVMRFFKFLSTQDLTDHIALSELQSPTSEVNVDANCISIEELHEIVDALLSDRRGHFFQRLFCAVAAILSYFASLRRGEITRLRIKDIYTCEHDGRSFTLHITNTAEGKTKSKHQRWVRIYLPEEFATLVRMCIQIKPRISERNGLHNRSSQTPLIGFENERPSSRQLHYLLPVTRAIKAVAGSEARFHHLRHSGAFLSLMQGLHLAFGCDESYSNLPISLQKLVSKEALNHRFQHWLEGQPFIDINDSLLFDELAREIGHVSFDTTRKHYIHGIEWLYPFYRQLGHRERERCYSRHELRYLLDLKQSSNDLSRQLSKMSRHYRALSVNERKSAEVHLSEQTLRHWLFLKRPDKDSLPTHPVVDTKYKHLSTLLLELMDKELTTSQPHSQPFPVIQKSVLKSLFAKQFNEDKETLMFSDLSTIWHHSNKHKHQDVDKKWIQSLKAIDTMEWVDDGERAIIRVGMACNQSSAKQFRIAFKSPQWGFLQTAFHLMHNRKTNPERKKQLIERNFADPGDDIIVTRLKGEGVSHFYVDVTLKPNVHLAMGTFRHLYEFIHYYQKTTRT